MYGTKRWFLRLENFLYNALHIDDDQSEREVCRLHNEVEMMAMYRRLRKPDLFHLTQGNRL